MIVQRTLLLSLRPRFADAILSGSKTTELRRRPVNAAPGTPIILYASAPIMAVVGTARLRAVHAFEPETAWQEHRQVVGLTRAEFDAYLDGSRLAYLLHLQQVSTLNDPLPLRTLRKDGPFQPPQSFRYVAVSDPASLKDLVPSRVGARSTARAVLAAACGCQANAPAHFRPQWTSGAPTVLVRRGAFCPGWSSREW